MTVAEVEQAIKETLFMHKQKDIDEFTFIELCQQNPVVTALLTARLLLLALLMLLVVLSILIQ